MINYRPDIDGLRAVAVLSVVMFHAGVPGFSGGYVGVDVFFVISGFLITSIIRDEVRAGNFSIADFYERRARRILPAFFVVLAVSALLATLTLYPHQFLAFSRSVIAASLFVSSFLFRSEAGYFDLESEQKPLLHTWSLSVEEIFYILFPLLLLLLRKRTDRLHLTILLSIAVISLAASAIALAQDPKSPSAFFLPYSRTWELILGALLTYGLVANTHTKASRWLGLLGIGMVMLAVVGYSNNIPFPGLAAILPCAGAALIIHGGRQHASLSRRVLSAPSLVWLGKISYALYLWHWPLLVFARVHFGDALGAPGIAIVLALSFVLAALSTRYIERPFRGARAILTRRAVFRLSGAGIALFAVTGLAGVASNGWSQRYSPEVAQILFAEQDQDPRQRECLNTKIDAKGCVYGDPDAEPTIALWGDSHAAVYSAMLGNLAREQQSSILVFTMPSCPPADGWLPRQSWRERCLRFQSQAMQTILDAPTIRTVLLSARFAGYPTEDPESGFETAFRKAIIKLRDAGKAVVVIYPVPELGKHVPSIMARKLEQGDTSEDLTRPVDDFYTTFEPAISFLNRVVKSEGIDAVQPSQVLCDELHCYFYRDGLVLYYDEHHLSLSGARQLEPLFRRFFDAMSDPDSAYRPSRSR